METIRRLLLFVAVAILLICGAALAAPSPPVSSIAVAGNAANENPTVPISVCKNAAGCGCPVCGKALLAESPYLEFARSQRIHACSDAHLEELLSSMPSYVLDDPSAAHIEHTHDDAEGTRCPICGMDGDAHNPIEFHGGQALIMCTMETKVSKAEMLSHPTQYISSKHTTSAAGSAEAKQHEAFCSGRTVMYMSSGFTWDDAVCLVFFYSGFVIDGRAKLFLAMLITFGLAVLHEWLMKVRRRLVFLQREARAVHWGYTNLAGGGSSSAPAGPSAYPPPRYSAVVSDKTPLLSGSSASTSTTASTSSSSNTAPAWAKDPWRLRCLDAAVAVLYGLSLSLGYIVMLSVMTYNLGLFIAAILGFVIGQYMFKDCDAPLHQGEPIEVATEPCCGGAA